MKTTIHYKNENGIFYPQFAPIVEQPETRPILKYGYLRGEYVKNHKEQLYMELKTSGTWKKHLADMQEKSDAMMKALMAKMLKADPGPDRNKNPMEWVQHMNMTQAQAEEILYAELLYV